MARLMYSVPQSTEMSVYSIVTNTTRLGKKSYLRQKTMTFWISSLKTPADVHQSQSSNNSDMFMM